MINKSIRDPFDRLCCSGVEEDKSFIDDGTFTTKRIKIGGHYLLWGKRRSYFPFHGMVGPDWIMVVLVYFLIIAIDAIILSVISPLGWPPVMIGLVGFVIVICAFSAVACTDPGIVYKNDFTPLDSIVANARTERAESESPLVGGAADIENQVGGEESMNTESPNKSNKSSKSNDLVNPAPLNINRTVDIPNSIECGQCDFRRPYSARHCNHCKTCVDELDHHCPWYVIDRYVNTL